MAFQIIKDSDSLKELPVRYNEYATVENRRKTGLKRFFAPKPGTVRVSFPEGPAYPVFRVTAPKWKGGQGDEWESLQQCYRKVLQMAADRRCEAITIPLLAAEDPDFPAYIDHKIAVDTIREFLKDHSLDVYLMVFRQNAVLASKLSRDVERFLSRNYMEWELPWSSRPFGNQEDKFDTIVPRVSISFEDREAEIVREIDASLEDAIGEWSAAQESVSEVSCGQIPTRQERFGDEMAPQEASHYRKCDPNDSGEISRKSRPAQPVKAAPRKAMVFEQSTGSLPDLQNLLRDMDAGFSETLLKLIDRSGKKDSEIYNKANVSRQHFSKIRNNPGYKPTKPTAIAFAIALELEMHETEDLIGRAGYRLTRSSKFDVIIMYFIQNRNYNMFDINETLYEFDQSLLGA